MMPGRLLLVPIASAVALGLLATACSPTIVNRGYRLDDAKVAGIVPGTTSREEVARIMGSPSSMGAFADNRWYYISQRTEQKTFYQQNLVSQDVVEITFDDKGIVQDVKTHDLQEARNVVPDPATTPAAGSEQTLLQEFFGNLGRFNPTAPSTLPGGGVPGG